MHYGAAPINDRVDIALAVISAVIAQPDIRQAAAEIKEAFEAKNRRQKSRKKY